MTATAVVAATMMMTAAKDNDDKDDKDGDDGYGNGDNDCYGSDNGKQQW